MATPTRTSFRLTGADGSPLHGDILTAGGGAGRPAVVICPGFKGAAERLAQAGFMAVSFDLPRVPVLRDLEIVMEALMRGEWGAVPSALGLLGQSIGGAIAVQRAARDPQVQALVTWGAAASPPPPPPPDVVSVGQVHAPWLIVRGDEDERAFELAMNATVDWFVKHLA